TTGSRSFATSAICRSRITMPPFEFPNDTPIGANKKGQRFRWPFCLVCREALLRGDRTFDLDERRVVLCRLFLDRLVAFGCDMAQACDGAAGSGRDETSDDDVFLEPFQSIDLAVDGGVGKYAGGLLVRRGRDHRARLQRRLGDAEKNRAAFGGLEALVGRLLVRLVQFDLVDLLTGQQRGVA